MTFERIYYAAASPKIFYTLQFKPGKDRRFKGACFGNYFLIERKFSRKIYHCLRK